MSNWTTNDIPDQNEKIAIVTGANSGIGYHTALELASKGALVILASRSMDKARNAEAEIRKAYPDARTEIIQLDLADLEAVGDFAATFKALHSRLDLLINNAGVMALPYRETADGYEMQFGTNHLGHFALTGHLLDPLLNTPASRIVTVSSNVHRTGKIKFDDLNSKQSYGKWAAYGQSKLANLLFAFELQRRLDKLDTQTISVGCHPGYAATNLQMAGPEMEGSALNRLLMQISNTLFAQDAAMGALPLLYAATAPDVNGGDYIGPSGLMKARGYPAKQRASNAAYNTDNAKRLWQVSEEMTGVRYERLDTALAGS